MRVLDVDMDFFLTDVCPLASVGERPAASAARPWDEEEVRAFLEEKCRLDRARPLPGRVFETHDGALDLWQAEMARGRLAAPFHVTHVDAHSDLGVGKPGPAYVLENVLARAPGERADLAKYRAEIKLDEANYLLFALAFRWIDSLINVRNPASRPDMPREIEQFGEADEARALRLRSTLGRLIPKYDFHEPEIPYRAVQGKDFCAEAPYDLTSLAISPRYAPREADFIADIFREYIVEI